MKDMIYLGAQFGGPELRSSAFRSVYDLVSSAFDTPTDRSIPEPAINLVFFVPGSVNNYSEIDAIRIERYSRKQNLVLVAVPVPAAIVATRVDAAAFILSSLRQSVLLAGGYFTKKGVLNFNEVSAGIVVTRVAGALQGTLAN